MPTPEDVKSRVVSAYNSAADHYDHAANSFWDRFGRRTIGRLDLAPAARVLDLCCGTGASALPAAAAVGPAGRVVAIDLAQDLVAIGRKKAKSAGLENLEFRVADILEGDFGSQSFDCVVCVFGLFFLPDMASALRRMWEFVRPSGRIAVTTWGSGLFEPTNSYFWGAVREVRPELYKSFNPWDRLGDVDSVVRLFASADLPIPEVEIERAEHPLRSDDDALALMLGTGYRGTLEQLSEADRARVLENVAEKIRRERVVAVRADVLYATCTRRPDARRST